MCISSRLLLLIKPWLTEDFCKVPFILFKNIQLQYKSRENKMYKTPRRNINHLDSKF